MTSSELTLSLLNHLPDIVRMSTEQMMIHQDRERAKRGEAATNRHELMIMAHEEDSCVVKPVMDMWRAPPSQFGAQQPDPDPPLTPHGPMAECLKFRWEQACLFNARWWLSEGQDSPDCRICHVDGHIAEFCPTKKQRSDTDADKRASKSGRNGRKRRRVTEHHTPGHKCKRCRKSGHTIAQCWTEHPTRKRTRVLTPSSASKRQRLLAAREVAFAFGSYEKS